MTEEQNPKPSVLSLERLDNDIRNSSGEVLRDSLEAVLDYCNEYLMKYGVLHQDYGRNPPETTEDAVGIARLDHIVKYLISVSGTTQFWTRYYKGLDEDPDPLKVQKKRLDLGSMYVVGSARETLNKMVPYYCLILHLLGDQTDMADHERNQHLEGRLFNGMVTSKYIFERDEYEDLAPMYVDLAIYVRTNSDRTETQVTYNFIEGVY